MATIAIIDDDIYISDMLDSLLRGAGYDVVRAYSGTEALYLLERTRPDLILLDLMLPGLSGEEVLPHIGDLPVIVLSACVNGQPVHLTPTEYAILRLLMQHPTQVLAKSTILERISRDTPDCTEGSLKQHVSNLRRKLREVGGRDYIDAVWGIGFKLADPS